MEEREIRKERDDYDFPFLGHYSLLRKIKLYNSFLRKI